MPDPNQTPPAEGQQTPPAPAAQTPPAVDVAAAVAQAVAAAKAEFGAELKKVTGFDSLAALQAHTLQEQGKLQELADSRGQEAANYKAMFEGQSVKNALLAAAINAIDPDDVIVRLAPKAICDANGVVTIDGQSASIAVAKLLTEKPHLAKAQGGTGSGAPQQAGTTAVNPWLDGQFNLTEQLRISKTNPALAAQLKAAAGK
jgi:hypothetical protein